MTNNLQMFDDLQQGLFWGIGRRERGDRWIIVHYNFMKWAQTPFTNTTQADIAVWCLTKNVKTNSEGGRFQPLHFTPLYLDIDRLKEWLPR